MTFHEANSVEAHLCDLLAGGASARPEQLASGLARSGGKITGLGWYYVAPADRHYLGVRFSSTSGRGKRMQ